MVIGDIIAKLYKWYWESFLCRSEPFTPQLRRMIRKWAFWWIVAGMGAGAAFLTWLFLHLGALDANFIIWIMKGN